MNRRINSDSRLRRQSIRVAIVGLLFWGITLSQVGAAAVDPSGRSLLASFLDGPMREAKDLVFAARGVNPTDGHWYANFGYYADNPERKAWVEGGKLYRLNLRSGELTALVSDPKGSIRDPQVSHDGRKVLFSWRRGGTEHYHLYELDLDSRGGVLGEAQSANSPASTQGVGSASMGIRQITEGPYDDFEGAYLPDGGIVFVSSRCHRWVNCWLTQVAVLHRCDADGSHLRALSSNNEQDNTPWPLLDGRILYTRWEYVDRSQVHFHHLWVANPDGTGQMTWFGNLHPGITMIDAKPIAGTDKVVASFSPGHGQREHDGVITVVDPKGGPDAKEFARSISKGAHFRDPWAFGEDCFLAASGASLVVMNGEGRSVELLRLPDGDRALRLECHEPRPVLARDREPILQQRVKPEQTTGRMLLADVHHGRNMEGVKPGEIRKLLVLETLPMPIHYTGGMEPISYGGTFTLERILGTIPVEPDGSAYFEVPAMRSVFFVALDENNMAVKRMQSFTSVQPGETLSCVGCHEHRSQTPRADFYATAAVRKAPAVIEPLRGVPDVFDFPRDVQPILDALCVECHGYERTSKGGPRAGRLLFTGDRGPLYSQSYYMLTIAGLFADGRNQPKSNYEPRTLGSSASRLLRLLDGTHYGVNATEHQKTMLRLWIETGAAYPGTYAALGCGMIGNYAENNQINTGEEWPETRTASDVIRKRCLACHESPGRRLPLTLADERGVSFWQPSMDDPRLLTSRHIVFNLSRPEQSLMLLAPLAREAGGWGLCQGGSTNAIQAVFAANSDPGYRAIHGMIEAGARFLASHRRFDMAGFVPRQDWFREMKRYGMLGDCARPEDVRDVYVAEQAYWRSLWHQPPASPP